MGSNDKIRLLISSLVNVFCSVTVDSRRLPVLSYLVIRDRNPKIQRDPHTLSLGTKGITKVYLYIYISIYILNLKLRPTEQTDHVNTRAKWQGSRYVPGIKKNPSKFRRLSTGWWC